MNYRNFLETFTKVEEAERLSYITNMSDKVVLGMLYDSLESNYSNRQIIEQLELDVARSNVA